MKKARSSNKAIGLCIAARLGYEASRDFFHLDHGSRHETEISKPPGQAELCQAIAISQPQLPAVFLLHDSR